MVQHRRRRPPAAYATDAGQPISEVNTTPLIDVMLVLLIMFILTIPIATHGVKMDLPVGKPPLTKPETHTLTMTSGGAVLLDGTSVAEAALPAKLQALESANPLSVLHFQVEGEARYEDFDRVLALVKGTGIERLGFVGNHDFLGAI
jgi:biopolymer transport protein ExbD